MNGDYNIVCFNTEVRSPWNIPNLTNYNAVNKIVGYLKMP